MKQFRAVILCMLVGSCLTVLSGCDQVSRLGAVAQHPTYSGCLQQAVAGSHSLSADDIRSLCSEAAEVIDTHYDYKDNAIVPSNDFTRCYDTEKKTLEAAQVSQAIRLAKLSCKYPNVH